MVHNQVFYNFGILSFENITTSSEHMIIATITPASSLNITFRLLAIQVPVQPISDSELRISPHFAWFQPWWCLPSESPVVRLQQLHGFIVGAGTRLADFHGPISKVLTHHRRNIHQPPPPRTNEAMNVRNENHWMLLCSQ